MFIICMFGKNNIYRQILQHIITETAAAIICKIERTKRNLWYDVECKEATKSKNEAYYRIIQKHYTRGAEEQCEEMRRI